MRKRREKYQFGREMSDMEKKGREFSGRGRVWMGRKGKRGEREGEREEGCKGKL